MPSYDYLCESCNYEFEAFHNVSTNLQECPQCKKSTLKKLIGGGGAAIVYGTKNPCHQNIKENRR